MIERSRRDGKRYLNPVPTSVGGVSTIFKVLPRYFFSKQEREPRQPLGPFRTDPGVFAAAPASGLRVCWFGHASMLVELDGARVLIDPVWEQRASPFSRVGPKRFFAPTLALEDLPPLDAVLISHDHFDHLGEHTAGRLARLQPDARWIAPLAVGAVLRGFGVPSGAITELDWTETARVGPVEITALPARHFSGRSLRNRFHTLWASWVLAGPRNRVFYGADSGEWEGFAEIGRQYGPFNLHMLEIGAFDPLWASIHMGPEGALRTLGQLGGGLFMPIHWGLFDLALHGWRQPISRVWEEPGVRLWAPEPGRPTEVDGAEVRSEWWRR